MIINYNGEIRNKYLNWEFSTLQQMFKLILERVGEWGLVIKSVKPAQIVNYYRLYIYLSLYI